MWIAIAATAGFLLGGATVFFMLEWRRQKVAADSRRVELMIAQLRQAQGQHAEDIATQRTLASGQAQSVLSEAKDHAVRLIREAQSQADALKATLDSEASAIRTRTQRLRWEHEDELANLRKQSESLQEEIVSKTVELNRIIKYEDLERESQLLKRDIVALDATVNKLTIDRDAQAAAQAEIDQKCEALGRRYLSDTHKSVCAKIKADNFADCKQRMEKAIEWTRGIGVRITEEEEANYIQSIKDEFEKAVRQALAREEQARIKQQLREEQQRERDIKREMDTIERERAAIQAALAKALADAHEAHSDEVERLKARLAEAEERNKRAIAQAQLTKAGHIYVVSNLGSFGEGVFKIGMTRRLEPLDRIVELSDASVPFPFDVHMMISCENAPALENALHREFHLRRLNKVNPRKEFFRVQLEEIARLVEEKHGKVEYIAEPEALEYHQSQSMSVEDQEYIEHAYQIDEEDDAAKQP